MASNVNVTLSSVISVLGYCLLPMVVLSGINVLITIQWVKRCDLWDVRLHNFHFFLYRGIIGTVLTAFSILWCAVSASKLFVTALSMDHQQILVAYPAALFYGVFALITIFWVRLTSLSIWNKVEKFKQIPLRLVICFTSMALIEDDVDGFLSSFLNLQPPSCILKFNDFLMSQQILLTSN